MPSRLRIALAVLALAAPAGAPRAADQAPTVMFLLDGSGSMWGPLGSDRRAKFEISRELLAQTLAKVRADTRMGLSSFGHRRRGYCGDVEVIVPPDANNLDKIMLPLPKLNATGMGPLALGLRETAKAIGTAAPATIVMIHDDIDNCSPDTCAAAAEIAKANPNLAIYSIGLGLGPQKLQQMSCVANATHGRAYDVQDAATLTSALDEVMKLANLQPGAAPTPPPDQTSKKEEAARPPQAPPGLYLTAGLGPDSATLESPVRWRIMKGGPDGEVVRDTRAAALVEKVPPGTYDVEARLGLASAHQSVDVKPEGPTQVRLDLNAGVLKMAARAAKTATPLPTATFTVTQLGGDAKKASAPLWISREAQPEIVLPAGEYKVTAEDGLARQEQTVKIAAATGTTVDAMLATGRLELTAARGNGSDAADVAAPGVTFIVYEDDPDSPQGRREVTRSAAPAPVFTLPAGTYYVTARAPGAEVKEQLAIGAGDTVKKILPLNLTHVKLSAKAEGTAAADTSPITYTVSRLDGEPREVLRTQAKEPDLDLAAGRYRIEARLGTTNVRAAAETTLAPGQPQKLALKLDAGRVTLRLADAQAAGAGDVFWEVRDDKRQSVMRSSDPQPTALLAPGHYIVTSETRDKQLHGAFELRAGETRTLDIGG
jgi:Ca-activated chloride channel family protein